MANPQQPELRRSEQVPALNPDAQEAELEARRDNRKREERRLVDPPPTESADSTGSDADGRPQDQPDLDAVAEQLGTADGRSSS